MPSPSHRRDSLRCERHLGPRLPDRHLAAHRFEPEVAHGELEAARRHASPLSAREREVAELVAQALSNREIAARLVLSERTVETHVRNILGKLGFTTRTEIATWLLRTTRDR